MNFIKMRLIIAEAFRYIYVQYTRSIKLCRQRIGISLKDCITFYTSIFTSSNTSRYSQYHNVMVDTYHGSVDNR